MAEVAVEVVYTPESSPIEVQIVFIHGLSGDMWETWTGPEADNNGDRYWPRWLARDLRGVAVWTVGYNAPKTSWSAGKALPLYDRALTLLDLLHYQEGFSRTHPIVFIVHSLGGLIIKEMLYVAHETISRYNWLAHNTIGIVFLATPHEGSDLARWLNYLQFVRPSAAIDDLESHAPKLRDRAAWFREWLPRTDIAIQVYRETVRLNGALVVDESSSDPSLPGVRPTPIDHADHGTISKPTSRKSPVYVGVHGFIREQLAAFQGRKSLPTLQYEVVIRAVVDDIDSQKLEQLLRSLGGDAALEIRSVRAGSVILEIEGSSEGYTRIDDLFRSGKLTELLGHQLLDVRIAQRLSGEQSIDSRVWSKPIPTTVSMTLAGRTLTIETGKVAEQADGAVTVRYGDSMVLSTAVSGGLREGLDFFPLTVEYEERMYAAGKIPGGFIKREGRPTENAILSARITDRTIRPLFPKGYKNETQIINTVFSADQENNPDILALIGTSTALTISNIPFDGPVGAVRIGLIDGELVVNPFESQMPGSKLDLIVAGSANAIVMVEGNAEAISEALMVEALELAHREIQPLLQLQHDLRARIGREKREFTPPARDETTEGEVLAWLGDRLDGVLFNPDKAGRRAGISALRAELVAALTEGLEGGERAARAKAVYGAFEEIETHAVRSAILERGERPDGRGLTEIRPIWTEVGFLPRAHGSAIFTRGQTQILTVATLGAPGEAQRLDSISPSDTKRYIHHYNFPPYSTGEAKPLRSTGRREIGHGALAEKALVRMLPDEGTFPYTLRLVSEALSSNGSTSMGSVCGSTMALLNAGVPLKAPVAGVAMGLMTGEDGVQSGYQILTDIQGLEDHIGDMDFKVAGTADGITAIQMDIKVKGLTFELMRKALSQARDGRLFILDKMMQTISTPGQMSDFAPRVERIKINTEKIGALIGPGGKTIRGIQEETGTKVDVQEDGTVSISGSDPAGVRRAIAQVEGLTREAKVGDIYTGKVVRIMPYGAFVEMFPGKDGLVHISELAEGRIERVEDVAKEGDEITVMVIDVDPGTGKVSLSRRAALTGEIPERQPAGPRGGGGFGGGGDRGPRPGGGFGGGDRGPRPSGGFGGDHRPTS